jgi:hypothetical protein
MIQAAMPTGARSMADAPGHRRVDHGMSIIASCATRTGQAK